MRRYLLSVLLLLTGGATLSRAGDFDVRAVYVDHRTQVMTLPALKELALQASRGGMNAMVVEYEASFPFQENGTLCGPDAFTRDEVEDLVDYCASIGIEVIPLQNCFGHCEYILRHPRYAALREDAHDLSQVCPMRLDEAEGVFRSIFREIAAVHPSRYIHIGCDETRLLGHDRRCAAHVAEAGTSRLYVDYVARMCRIVRELGKVPVIWGDIILQHPEALADLPKDLIVVDWNYGWSTRHFGDIDAVLEQGITMWGASSLRSAPDNLYLVQWDKHFANLATYLPFCREKGFSGIIQTSWSTSGVYHYISDNGFDIIDLQPVRQVYPMSGFNILLQAFYSAAGREEPLDVDAFIRSYASDRFGLAPEALPVLVDYFKMPQREVTGASFTAAVIADELTRARALRQRMETVRPRRNVREMDHLRLALDIRVNYLEFKAVQRSFETAGADRAALSADLRPVLKEAQALRRRFIRLQRGYLKDPASCVGPWSYIHEMERLSDTLGR